MLLNLKYGIPPLENGKQYLPWVDIKQQNTNFKFTQRLLIFINEARNIISIQNSYYNSHNIAYNVFNDPLTSDI